MLYCRQNNADEEVLWLLNNLKMVDSLNCQHTDIRFIVLAGVNVATDTDTALGRLQQENNAICVLHEPHLEASAAWRVLLHLFVRVYGLLHGQDEAMYKLSDFLFKMLYSDFGTGRDQ